jgi:hypothetical protein
MIRFFKEYIDYKYNINQYNYNIDIIISKYKIQIYHNEKVIIIKKTQIWNGQYRYIIMNNDKITVLHPIIKKDQLQLYKHILSAFKHIYPFFNESDLLVLFISILSLKDYHTITKKFYIFWDNIHIKENFKLLTYKLEYEKISIMK